MGMSSDVKNAWPPETDKEQKYIASIVDSLRFQHGMNYEDIRTFIAEKVERPVTLHEFEDVMMDLERWGV